MTQLISFLLGVPVTTKRPSIARSHSAASLNPLQAKAFAPVATLRYNSRASQSAFAYEFKNYYNRFMATILSIAKDALIPVPQDYKETARYLGYHRLTEPEEKIQELIKNCCSEMFAIICPKAVFDSFDLKITSVKSEANTEEKSEEQKALISFSDVSFNSKSLGINLKDCSTVYLMAATIGPQVDALIRKTQIFDSVKASIFQATGAMFIEKVVDYVNQEIKKMAATQNKSCKPRFSPGYGDVSLELQKDFFRILPCSKIGLSLMDTLIMAPEKSVTAFIGAY